ncbi:unnamed protein product [Notodromas monacha]|uniref:Uncharacterized protein n=1 Tax=Notodromas monacha TaxID=399045 RepID=A0A7R9BX48_9CRUS|nr:unnamed protein product [Notodromas monacha]CAG0923412.1 unnamed protein product [Notodromas monacha]
MHSKPSRFYMFYRNRNRGPVRSHHRLQQQQQHQQQQAPPLSTRANSRQPIRNAHFISDFGSAFRRSPTHFTNHDSVRDVDVEKEFVAPRRVTHGLGSLADFGPTFSSSRKALKTQQFGFGPKQNFKHTKKHSRIIFPDSETFNRLNPSIPAFTPIGKPGVVKVSPQERIPEIIRSKPVQIVDQTEAAKNAKINELHSKILGFSKPSSKKDPPEIIPSVIPAKTTTEIPPAAEEATTTIKPVFIKMEKELKKMHIPSELVMKVMESVVAAQIPEETLPEILQKDSDVDVLKELLSAILDAQQDPTLKIKFGKTGKTAVVQEATGVRKVEDNRVDVAPEPVPGVIAEIPVFLPTEVPTTTINEASPVSVSEKLEIPEGNIEDNIVPTIEDLRDVARILGYMPERIATLSRAELLDLISKDPAPQPGKDLAEMTQPILDTTVFADRIPTTTSIPLTTVSSPDADTESQSIFEANAVEKALVESLLSNSSSGQDIESLLVTILQFIENGNSIPSNLVVELPSGPGKPAQVLFSSSGPAETKEVETSSVAEAQTQQVVTEEPAILFQETEPVPSSLLASQPQTVQQGGFNQQSIQLQGQMRQQAELLRVAQLHQQGQLRQQEALLHLAHAQQGVSIFADPTGKLHLQIDRGTGHAPPAITPMQAETVQTEELVLQFGGAKVRVDLDGVQAFAPNSTNITANSTSRNLDVAAGSAPQHFRNPDEPLITITPAEFTRNLLIFYDMQERVKKISTAGQTPSLSSTQFGALASAQLFSPTAEQLRQQELLNQQKQQQQQLQLTARQAQELAANSKSALSVAPLNHNELRALALVLGHPVNNVQAMNKSELERLLSKDILLLSSQAPRQAVL